MKHPTGLFILLMSLAAFSVEGEYLFNSRFELGSCGYAFQRYLSPEENSALEFSRCRRFRSRNWEEGRFYIFGSSP